MTNLRDYIIVTASYWVFTLTDGALRMLVLLHLHQLGHSPLEIASLFLLYETFGVLTNFFGGWIGARHGLGRTLLMGLALQVVACGLLAGPSSWLTIPLLMLVQALSGVAKDLTKMSSKSYIKLVVPEGDSRGLLKWVAILTGSKNTLKGCGFFSGGALLAAVGLQTTCAAMAIALLATLLGAAFSLPPGVGKSRRSPSLSDLVPRDARIRWLSFARMLLFGARDAWFVIGLPLFLSTELGWTHAQVGGFLALWIIGYGIMQASAPRLLRRADGRVLHARELGLWTVALVLPIIGIAIAMQVELAVELSLVSGLMIFGLIFAVCSALHSFLIIDYAEGDKVALRVGFYYMANALGRLLGTVISGAVYQAGGQGAKGLLACLVISCAMVLASSAACYRLRREERASLR
ncbi:MAG: MFS family permease [Planctomycetota bacterium]|jgi:MFS family permease